MDVGTKGIDAGCLGVVDPRDESLLIELHRDQLVARHECTGVLAFEIGEECELVEAIAISDLLDVLPAVGHRNRLPVGEGEPRAIWPAPPVDPAP